MRQPRKASESGIYHVVARGTGRQLIFSDDEDRTRFLEILRRRASADCVCILAWCLMGNHIHLLLRSDLDIISACMRRTLGPYAEYYNEKTGRVGHLFQDRFISEPVEQDEYLLTVVAYIHNNPVKAGLASVDGYRWSSFHEYLGDQGICDTGLVLDMCGGADGFKRLHAGPSTGRCIDVDERGLRRRSMPDEEAMEIAVTALGGITLEEIKTLDPDRRRLALVALKRAGLTVRQIERLTGVGRNIVQRAKADE